MPTITWSLSPWHNQQAHIDIEIDPALINGHRGVFGPALILPFKATPALYSTSETMLHSLEGWILWHSDPGLLPGIRIPSQTVGANSNNLQIPITDEQIEAIERMRAGGAVTFQIALAGLATLPNARVNVVEYVAKSDGSVTPEPRSRLEVHEVREPTNASKQIRIERERWLEILERLGAGRRRLVELPDPRLPAQDTRWNECMRLLSEATQLYRSGHYEQVLKNCRTIVEGATEVLCASWGITRDPKRSFHVWSKDLPAQLASVWTTDPEDAIMFYALLNAAWKWTSSSHHYGSGIPAQDEVAFALSLTTNLLMFTAQIVAARPTNP